MVKKYTGHTVVSVFAVLLAFALNVFAGETTEVGLYRTFETSVTNDKSYSNKFTDVNLLCTYTAPSGKQTDFYGFFDGDNVWRMRFMPDELGEWTYTWKFSDGSKKGNGSFVATSENAGKGILRAYTKNPRWFAYNGTDPVYIKSYYESGNSSIAQGIDWVSKNVYQPLIDNGYNHFQVNWLMPLCCEGAYYHDDGAPLPSKDTVRIYKEGKATSTMQLDVWKMLEDHVRYLNDKNIGLHMFVGFDGSQNAGPAWSKLSDTEKDFYVRYVVSRLAPFANIAGWNFVWEVDGDREAYELGWARLVKKYDVFNHLRTYEDETPKTNNYNRDEYTFASVENHLIYSSDKTTDRPHWTEAWTHHEACLSSYVKGKPVFMTEGNALWRRYWVIKLNTTQDQLRQAAWGCAMAAASFTWCGHSQNPLMARGPEGIPYFDSDNAYVTSAKAIDLLSRILSEEVTFYNMDPADGLLFSQDTLKTWALADPGDEYLVFSANGSPFTLRVKAGKYSDNEWINAITGETVKVDSLIQASDADVKFTPPTTSADWVLLLRKGDAPTAIPFKGTPLAKSRNSKALYSPDGRVHFENGERLAPGFYARPGNGGAAREIRN